MIPIPMDSKPLKGAACDISDPEGLLLKWCEENEELIRQAGIAAIELDTVGWVHFQIEPTNSENFWFTA